MIGKVRKLIPYLVACSIIILSSCADKTDPYNSLTKEEKKEGWQLLFDGRSTKGWHAFNEKTIPPVWQVKHGELWCVKIPSNLLHADLVTDSVY